MQQDFDERPLRCSKYCNYFWLIVAVIKACALIGVMAPLWTVEYRDDRSNGKQRYIDAFLAGFILIIFFGIVNFTYNCLKQDLRVATSRFMIIVTTIFGVVLSGIFIAEIVMIGKIIHEGNKCKGDSCAVGLVLGYGAMILWLIQVFFFLCQFGCFARYLK